MSLACDEQAAARERGLAEILDGFAGASPELLGTRNLLRRIDSKFVFHKRGLADVLRHLTRDYLVVFAGSHRLAMYRTLYFDTPDLQCFHAHRRGRRPRHKIRLRHYPDRHVSFFEIKTKKTEVLTQKVRVDVPFGVDDLPDRAHDLVRAHGGLGPQLEPQLWTDFQRLTLIGKDTHERVTIDLDLRMGKAGSLVDLDGVVIAEVKQGVASARTPVMTILRAAGLRPTSASKYCTAIALTREGLRLNRLLPTLRMIGRIQP
jgi:hypothetical protein